MSGDARTGPDARPNPNPEDLKTMWLFHPEVGFLSVVRKPGDGRSSRSQLTIRARARADLDRLRKLYLPTLSATVSTGGTDYPYRARATAIDWSDACSTMAREIDYGNFKSEVARVQGHHREAAYHKVWAALMGLEDADRMDEAEQIARVTSADGRKSRGERLAGAAAPELPVAAVQRPDPAGPLKGRKTVAPRRSR